MATPKPSVFSTVIRALMRRPNEADAIARVGVVAERELRHLEDQAEADQRAAAAFAAEAKTAETNAARLQQRIEELRADRQRMAEHFDAAQQQSAAAFALAVAAGDTAAEAAALELPADVRDAPALIARMDSMLSALEAEAQRAAQLVTDKRGQADKARRVAMARRCEEAAIQYDEAANALLLAAARVYAANEAAGLIQPPQVQRLEVPFFSRERSVYAELTGNHEHAGHPPPVINSVTVREIVRAVQRQDQAQHETDSDTSAATKARPA